MKHNKKLKQYRASLGITQREVTERLGTPKNFYSDIENGSRTPSYNFLKKLKRAFPDINIGDIFFS
ncbi:helix-turn-helix transcriptional regulator [Clostridia bacterium]|nr:helix-turn-helix transcriptional regulator [Clostridia bacterium]